MACDGLSMEPSVDEPMQLQHPDNDSMQLQHPDKDPMQLQHPDNDPMQLQHPDNDLMQLQHPDKDPMQLQHPDDDDPVVAEIPVFLSHSPHPDNLFLFQYPVRPGSMPYERESVQAARIKPLQKRVQLVVGVDSTASNYDKSKGKQIVLNAQGPNPSAEEKVFHGSMMDKQTLTSTLAVDSTSRFAAGILLQRKREDSAEASGTPNSELHLMPLHGIAQLRPSLDYLDHADVLKSRKEADGHSSMEEEEEEEAQQVTVRFARGGATGRGSSRGGARTASSWRRRQRQLEEEPWISDVRWHGTIEAGEIARKLENARDAKACKADLDSPPCDVAEPPVDYLKALLPSDAVEGVISTPAMPNNVLSLLELKTLSIAQSIHALLVNAKVMRFAQILQLISQNKSASNSEILTHLQQMAVLIRGCWVVKSELLYPDKFLSRHSGVVSSLLRRGRDYMLWKFTQSPNVTRKDIQSTTKLPAEDILEMLEGVARMRHGYGWTFRIEKDDEFISRHSDIVAKQSSFWDQRVKALTSQGLKIVIHSTSNSELQPKSRRRLNSEVSSSDDSDGGRRGSASNSPRPARNRKSSLRQNSASSPKAGRRVLDAEVPMVVGEISLNGTGNGHSIGNGDATVTDVENSSPSSTVACHPEFVQFVEEKLQAESVMKLSDVKRMFQFRLAELDPGSALGKCGFNERMVAAAVAQIGATKLPFTLPKGSDFAGEPLYAVHQRGDEMDPLRPTVLALFQDTGKISGKVFRQKMDEAWRSLSSTADAMPDSVFNKLRQEFTISRNSVIYLKNTI